MSTSIKELQKQIAEMKKSVNDAASLSALINVLSKTRKRLSDEHDPNADEENDELGDGFREFDPDQEENDDASKWLEENEKKNKAPSDDEEADDYGSEDDPKELDMGGDKPKAKRSMDEEENENQSERSARPEGDKKPAGNARSKIAAPNKAQQAAPGTEDEVEDVKQNKRFPQPSKDDITEMRQHTRPWEQRSRDYTRLKAEAHKNPVLHHEGQIVEARNNSHRSFKDAHHAFTNSDDYKNADPISQMDMEDDFKKKFHEENPDHLTNAVRAHEEAHVKGSKAKDLHAASRDEQIRHVMRGGAQSDNAMSAEEAMQHAGGSKTDEGTTGSMIQDSASSFAHGNQDMLNQMTQHASKYKTSKEFDDHMRQLRNPAMRDKMLAANPELKSAEANQGVIRRIVRGNERAKAGQSFDDIMSYNDKDPEKDIKTLLDSPGLNDPAKKAKAEKFLKQYHPLINMSARRVFTKLGIDPDNKNNAGHDYVGAMHEAGLNGLYQAINDYDHENPKKTSFATHAGHKIRGLMQTAMRGMDQIPSELRSAAKKQSQSKAPAATSTAAPTPAPAPKAEAMDIGLPETKSEIPSAPAVPKQSVTDVVTSSGHPASADIHDRLKRTDTQRAAHGVILRKPSGSGESQ